MATRNISTKLAISGESEYRSALKNINSELKALQSNLKLTQSQYQTNANSMQALSAKGEALRKVYEAQQKKVDELKKALENAKKAEQEYAKQKEDLSKKIEANNKALEALKKTTGDTTAEEKKLTEENARLQKELDGVEAKLSAAQKGTNDWQIQLNNAQIQLNDLDAEIQKNDKYLDEASKAADGCAKSIDEFGREVKESTEETKEQTNALETLVSVMASDVLSGAADKIAGALKACVSAAMDFEYQMSGVKAIANASAEEMEALNQKALDIGASTMYTASQAAEAMSYMALAGWKAEEMLEGIGGVINLAAASGENLATVSDIVTDALTAFGLQAKDSEHFVDVLAKTAASSNTTVTMLGEAFKYAAPLAGALGYSVEDVAVAMGLMANQGIKGSQAGTTLRTMFTKLTGDVTLSGRAFGDVTVSAANSDGTMKSLSETLDELRFYFGQMTDAEKLANAEAVAGRYAMSGLTALMNTTEADFESLTNAILDCDGAAQQMADTRMDNLQGQVTLLESAFDGLKIAVGESLAPTLKDIAAAGTDALSKATEFVRDHPKLTQALTLTAGGIVGITAAIAEVKAAYKILDFLGMTKGLKALTAAAAEAGGGLSGFGVILGGLATTAGIVGTALLSLYTIMDRAKELETVGLLGEGHTLDEYKENVENYKQKIIELQEEYNNLAECGGDLTMAQDALSMAEIGLENATVEYMDELHKLGQTEKEVAEGTDELTESVNTQSYTLDDARGDIYALAEAYMQAYSSARESLEGQIGLFDEYTKSISEETDTAAEMLQRWQQQVWNLDEYTRNLEKAAKYGLDDGLVKSLADGSTESAGYLYTIIQEIENCANGTGTLGTSAEDAVAKFNAAFEQTEEAKDNLAETMAAINTGLEEALEAMQECLDEGVSFEEFYGAVDLAFEEVGVRFKDIGINMGAGMIGGMQEKSPEVSAAATAVADDATNATKTALGIQSPSTVFHEIGVNVDLGLIEGINQERPNVENAVREMGESVTQIMQTSATNATNLWIAQFQRMVATTSALMAQNRNVIVNSMNGVPSQMQSIGANIVDGMIQGLRNREGALYAEIRRIVASAIAAAKAAASVKSPSAKTKEIFEYVGEGMIVGIKSKKQQVEDATADVVRSAVSFDANTIHELSKEFNSSLPDLSGIFFGSDGKKETRSDRSDSRSKNMTFNNTFSFAITTQKGQSNKEIAEYVMEYIQNELDKERRVFD